MKLDHDNAPWGLVETALDGTIHRVNERFASWTGRSVDTLLGKVRWKEVLTPASVILYETHFVPRLHALRSVNEIVLDLKRPDGTRFPILACAIRVEGSENDIAVAITVFDATETRRHERELRDARRTAEQAAQALLSSNAELHAQNEKLRVTLQSIADAVVTTDIKGNVTSLNATAEEISGISAAQALGQPIHLLGRFLDADTRRPVRRSQLFKPRGHEFGASYLFERRDGELRYVGGTVSRVRDQDGKVVGTVYVCHDATQARAAAMQIAYEASHDYLTGLYNRREFERLCTLACIDKPGAEASASDLLLYVDLDQFKVINDSAGHAAGDEALLKVTRVLQDSIQHQHSLARLGGDEFGVLLHRCPAAVGVEVAEAMRVQLQQLRIAFGEKVYGVTASIGIAELTRGENAVRAAMAEADMACTAAKEAGRNRVHLFSATNSELDNRQQEMSWVSRIRRGLDENRFRLYVQPIVPIGGVRPGQRMKGELLLRYMDDSGSLIAPGSIIASAERFNLMGQVDRWVVRRAFEWLETTTDMDVCVNVSGQSFGDPNFRDYVVELIGSHAFEPSRVCFEITETAAVANFETAQLFIAELRAHGIKLALDDFGVGLSSFGYLRTFSPDYIKIDGSFVKSMSTDPVNREIVESIYRIARACSLETVAEWVENQETLEMLTGIGVDYAQGWHVGKPRPIE